MSGAANAAQSLRIIRDTEIEVVMQKLVEPIARAAKIPDGRLRVHIVHGNDLNAFVSSGEDIYIYAGTIMKIENPNAVQAIVAHELGHIIGGHYVNRMARIEKEMIGAIIMQSLGVALIAANPEMGTGVMMGAHGITRANLMSFSRDEERQADTLGLGLMKSARLPLGGFVEMMELLQSRSIHIEGSINTYGISHPTTTERLMNAREWISKHGGHGGKLPDDLVAEYAMVRAKLVGYLQSEKVVQDMYPTQTLPSKYAHAISALRGDRLTKALQLTNELVASDPKNPYFHELVGDIQVRRGKYSEAVAAYQKALELLDIESAQISAAIAMALIERKGKGDAEEAVRIIKRALILGKAEAAKTPFLYFVLARAYAAKKKHGLSDWAMAEYNWIINKKPEAKKFAERAKRNLDGNSPEYQKVQDILAKK